MLALRFRYTTACGDAEIRSCDELTVMRRMMMMMEQGAAAHLVFLFELFCGTKVQQAHVDQLLEVLVESKDVPPEGRSRTASRLEPPAAKTETGLGGGGRGGHLLYSSCLLMRAGSDRTRKCCLTGSLMYSSRSSTCTHVF